MENLPPKDCVSFRELLGSTQEESRRWQEWFNKNPQALDVKIDIAQTPDVRTLILHIAYVELRYAEWLAGEPVTPWQSISLATADSLFAVSETAFRKFRKMLETRAEDYWTEKMIFPKPFEGMKASRRKCLVHVIFHSLRHWAQLATTLRAAGYAQDWQHDFLFSTAME